ncbi:MAG TPA: tyrosine-protein phosphatase [Vicinamibacterales bacterium]|nr:tyrosine-protein phosphatase [Vicinamibacterales bacterium]
MMSAFPTCSRKLAASAAGLALSFQLSAVSISARDGVSKFERKVAEVVPGKIYRGTQPGSEEDYEYLRKLGIKTHLNLRKYLGWQEQEVHLNAVIEGFFYRHAALPTLWNKPKDREVAEALGALNDPSLQPIFVHCRLGKDRTGLVIALYRVLYQQWDACTAWKEWKSFGYLPWNNGLKNYFEERLRKETRIAGYDPDFDVGRCGR